MQETSTSKHRVELTRATRRSKPMKASFQVFFGCMPATCTSAPHKSKIQSTQPLACVVLALACKHAADEGNLALRLLTGFISVVITQSN